MDSEFWTIFFASQAFLLLAMGFALGIFKEFIEGLKEFFKWVFLTCYEVLDVFEEGVILRFGKHHDTLTGGLHFIAPWGIDKLTKETVVRQTKYLEVQSLTTADNKKIALAAIVIFKITDIAKFLLEIDDGEVDVMNIVYGVISDCVEAHDWSYIYTAAFNKEVLHKARLATKDNCGVHVITIKWSDKTTARSIRLWND